MAIKDWINLTSIQAEARRLSAMIAALVSFLVLSTLVTKIVGPGWLTTCIGYVEKFVLLVLVLFYAGRLLYDVYLEIKGTGHGLLVVT